MSSDIYITSAIRTPIADFLGSLSRFQAPDLSASLIRHLIETKHITPEIVDQLILGQVLTAGNGQAPVKQAALKGGLTPSTLCTGVSKVCGSGMQSIIYGVYALMTGNAELVLAGGMESMSRAPYLLPKTRHGTKLGHVLTLDSLIFDGLWDSFGDAHMGEYAEACVKKYEFTRQMQDDFASSSYQRAIDAVKKGYFKSEIVPLKDDKYSLDHDESPSHFNPDKMSHLKPVFHPQGTITSGNASSINDGAALLTLMSKKKAKVLNHEPLAKIVDFASYSSEPVWFTTAPAGAIQALLKKTKKSLKDIDLFEINEAFSCVNLANYKILDLDPKKVNVHGGAVALGHPIGASGARIVTTLIHALRQRKKKRGIAAICIGGGEALAMMIEVC